MSSCGVFYHVLVCVCVCPEACPQVWHTGGSSYVSGSVCVGVRKVSKGIEPAGTLQDEG